MKPFKRPSGWVLGAFLVGSAAPTVLAESRPNTYQAIVERNPFGLKPPPPLVDTKPPPPATQLAKVVMTGIVSMFGPNPRALLEITETEPGKAATVRKPILRAGEQDGSVEVVSIDLEKGLAKIRNGGTEAELSFETPKLAAGTAPPAGFAPPPLTGASPNGMLPNSPANTPGRHPGVTIIGGGSPPLTAPGASSGGFPSAAVNGSSGLRTIPSRAVRAEGSAASYPPVPVSPLSR